MNVIEKQNKQQQQQIIIIISNTMVLKMLKRHPCESIGNCGNCISVHKALIEIFFFQFEWL